MEWVIGAQWSYEGKSIIALRSSYVDKAGVRHSKIKPFLTPGGVVTTPRTFVQYVVTEYGVADLRFKSCHERGKALIAHCPIRISARSWSGICPCEKMNKAAPGSGARLVALC